MQIKKEFPPNFNEIAKALDISDVSPVFAYGDTLYNPTGGPISEDLMKHEQVHEQQQQALGVENWWSLYLEKPTFRLEQELQAYREQYKAIQTMPRAARRYKTREMARNLSGKMYGNIINFEEALELITK